MFKYAVVSTLAAAAVNAVDAMGPPRRGLYPSRRGHGGPGGLALRGPAPRGLAPRGPARSYREPLRDRRARGGYGGFGAFKDGHVRLGRAGPPARGLGPYRGGLGGSKYGAPVRVSYRKSKAPRRSYGGPGPAYGRSSLGYGPSPYSASKRRASRRPAYGRSGPAYG